MTDRTAAERERLESALRQPRDRPVTLDKNHTFPKYAPRKPRKPKK